MAVVVVDVVAAFVVVGSAGGGCLICFIDFRFFQRHHL